MSTPEELQPDVPDAEPAPTLQNFTGERQSVSDAVEQVVGLTADQLKLKTLRELGELSEHDFDLNELANYIGAGIALRKADLQNCAIVLTPHQFEDVGGYMDIVFKNGEEMRLETETMNDAVLIIFPGDLAD